MRKKMRNLTQIDPGVATALVVGSIATVCGFAAVVFLTLVSMTWIVDTTVAVSQDPSMFLTGLKYAGIGVATVMVIALCAIPFYAIIDRMTGWGDMGVLLTSAVCSVLFLTFGFLLISFGITFFTDLYSKPEDVGPFWYQAARYGLTAVFCGPVFLMLKALAERLMEWLESFRIVRH